MHGIKVLACVLNTVLFLFLQSSEFCLLLPGLRLASLDLLDAMMTVSSPLLGLVAWGDLSVGLHWHGYLRLIKLFLVVRVVFLPPAFHNEHILPHLGGTGLEQPISLAMAAGVWSGGEAAG